MTIEVLPFYEEHTGTLTYLVHRDGRGVVIDPLLDYEARSARVTTASADAVCAKIAEKGLEIPYVLDTHAHADHLSALELMRQRLGAETAIGSDIGAVQSIFRDVYDLGADFPVDGSQFDHLLKEGDALDAGTFRIEAIHTPGHTPACVSYRIEDALFVGDALFQPDYGTARCDFPGGSADALYDSIQRIYALPGDVRVFTGHDYRPGGRPMACEASVEEHRRANVQLDANTTREAFVRFRSERDAGLAAPELIWPSIQVNVRAGHLPEPAPNGRRYLKIPLDVKVLTENKELV